jgi:aspartyl-tRNA synthetase
LTPNSLSTLFGTGAGALVNKQAAVWVLGKAITSRANDDGSLSAIHHPFTAPSVDAKTLESTATTALSRAYDLVINGSEVGGGSIRIHQVAMQPIALVIENINLPTVLLPLSFSPAITVRPDNSISASLITPMFFIVSNKVLRELGVKVSLPEKD